MLVPTSFLESQPKVLAEAALEGEPLRLCLVQRNNEFRPDMIIDHAASTGSPLCAAQDGLLRWLGVELFAGTFFPVTRRHMRLAHRLVLSALARACPEPARRGTGYWSEDGCPLEVLVELRPLLAGRPAFAPGR